MQKKILALSAALACLAVVTPAQAQMDNRPFSFKRSPDGIGMSLGGKQAILDQKNFGTTPDNLLRSSNGALLGLREGVGKTAIVTDVDGNILPTFKGSSFRGNNSDMSFGTFNAFFSPVSRDKSPARSISSMHSGATINSWTARVITGGVPATYLPNNSVDEWTAMAQAF